MIHVAANDVAFSIHAVVLTALTLFQIFIYEVSTFLLTKKAVLSALFLSSSCCIWWFLCDLIILSAWTAKSIQICYRSCDPCLGVCSYLFLHCFTFTLLALAHYHLQVCSLIPSLPFTQLSFIANLTLSVWFIVLYSSIQVAMTCVKYIPQVRNNPWTLYFCKQIHSSVLLMFMCLFSGEDELH